MSCRYRCFVCVSFSFKKEQSRYFFSSTEVYCKTWWIFIFTNQSGNVLFKVTCSGMFYIHKKNVTLEINGYIIALKQWFSNFTI